MQLANIISYISYYCIQLGETTIGSSPPKEKTHRNSLTLSYDALSKEHCLILIDGNEHFIMALTSNIQRRNHVLRPNVYYELTDGVQLILGDGLNAQYHYCDGKDEVSDTTGTPSPKSITSLPHFSPPFMLQTSDNEQGKFL